MVWNSVSGSPGKPGPPHTREQALQASGFGLLFSELSENLLLSLSVPGLGHLFSSLRTLKVYPQGAGGRDKLASLPALPRPFLPHPSPS